MILGIEGAVCIKQLIDYILGSSFADVIIDLIDWLLIGIKQLIHCRSQRNAKRLEQSFPRMVKAADSFPGMLEALKDEVRAIYQCPIDIKEYCSRVAVCPVGMLFYIEN